MGPAARLRAFHLCPALRDRSDGGPSATRRRRAKDLAHAGKLHACFGNQRVQQRAPGSDLQRELGGTGAQPTHARRGDGGDLLPRLLSAAVRLVLSLLLTVAAAFAQNTQNV